MINIFNYSLFVFLSFVNQSPGVGPSVECLILPDDKGLMIDNSWLNNFLSLEDTPGHGVNICVSYVLEFLPSCVHCLPSELLEATQALSELVYESAWNE